MMNGASDISPMEWVEVLADTEPAVVGTESMDERTAWWLKPQTLGEVIASLSLSGVWGLFNTKATKA